MENLLAYIQYVYHADMERAHGVFEWDPAKARHNALKHGIRFDDAAAMLASDAYQVTVEDVGHSERERRWITIGSLDALTMMVVWTARGRDGDHTRIISARRANQKERTWYEQSKEQNRS